MNKIIVTTLLMSFVLLTPLAVQSAKPQSGADWTFAIYMSSDNDLEPWAQEDIDEMMMIGSTNEINVVVMWDKYAGPAGIYKVVRNGLEELTDSELNGVEPNMGDSVTLRSFVTYASKRFPATRFALMCWDHGDDFRGLMYDRHIPDQGFDLLTHQEVVTALSGFRIDVLVYGACVLQMIEVSYEYCSSGLNIGYFVANEGYDPLSGLPFDAVLSRLAAQPSVSPLKFSTILVDEYIWYYDDSAGMGQSQAVTLSVVDVRKVEKLVEDLTSFTNAIMSDMSGYAKIVSDGRGRANLPWSENGWERLVDLTTFVKTVHDESLDPKLVRNIDQSVVASVISSSEAVLSSLSETIVYHKNTHVMEKARCYGIGIYFPTSRASYENNDHIYGSLYELMRFPHQGWLEFLNAYWDTSA